MGCQVIGRGGMRGEDSDVLITTVLICCPVDRVTGFGVRGNHTNWVCDFADIPTEELVRIPCAVVELQDCIMSNTSFGYVELGKFYGNRMLLRVLIEDAGANALVGSASMGSSKERCIVEKVRG